MTNCSILKASNKKKVIVGMSGGVDSSVSAHLLIEAGYDVHGLFMKNWEEDDSTEHCTAAKDRQDAESVCQQLGIPLHTVNFAHEYWERVFSDCLDEFKAGRTPNPDILCNREIKFKEFLDHAIRLGADHIATGHYARSFIDEHGEYQLLRGIDSNKDQSYFLYAVNHAALEKTLFPIGEYQKPEIRAIAQQLGFITHDKKDSTGICFIGERHFKTFLESYLPKERGNMVTPEDEIVGQHDGLMYYTIGQRQGLGIGGQKNASDDPWFVYGKDLNSNTLYVVQGHDHPVLFSQHLSAVQLNLISKTPLKVGDKLSAKARYRQADQPCTISAIDENGFSLTFDSPQRAVTPGQSVVLYKDQQCLGGGIIDKVS